MKSFRDSNRARRATPGATWRSVAAGALLLLLLGALAEAKAGGLARVEFGVYGEHHPVRVTPAAPSAPLPLRFVEIANFDLVTRGLGLEAGARQALERNGFVVVPHGTENDMLAVYTNSISQGVPNFITSDSLLHLYHIQFEEILRRRQELGVERIYVLIRPRRNRTPAQRFERGLRDWLLPSTTSAPYVEGDRLYYVTAECQLRCLDTQGFGDSENDGPYQEEIFKDHASADIVWQLDMPALGVFPHETCNSEVLCLGDLLMVATSNGQNEGHTRVPSPRAPSLIAVNKHSGEVVWHAIGAGGGVLHGAWSSPVAANVKGRMQVLFGGGDGWLRAYDAASGHEIWRFDGNPKDARWLPRPGVLSRSSIIASPVFADGRIRSRPGRSESARSRRGLALDGAGHGERARAAAAVAVDRKQRRLAARHDRRQVLALVRPVERASHDQERRGRPTLHASRAHLAEHDLPGRCRGPPWRRLAPSRRLAARPSGTNARPACPGQAHEHHRQTRRWASRARDGRDPRSATAKSNNDSIAWLFGESRLCIRSGSAPPSRMSSPGPALISASSPSFPTSRSSPVAASRLSWILISPCRLSFETTSLQVFRMSSSKTVLA